MASPPTTAQNVSEYIYGKFLQNSLHDRSHVGLSKRQKRRVQKKRWGARSLALQVPTPNGLHVRRDVGASPGSGRISCLQRGPFLGDGRGGLES
eukprot:2957408-Amphidinium_carterae.1